MRISEIIREHENSGRHFFSPGAMRYFNSRISSYTRGRLFISSERQDYETPRLYTVRRLEADGGISTVGDFQEYDSLYKAKKALDEAYLEECENGNRWIGA